METTLNNSHSALQQIEEIKKHLWNDNKKRTGNLSNELIDKICSKQAEITELEMKLFNDEKIQRIITNINIDVNTINVEQGNVLVGNQIGGNAEFLHTSSQSEDNWNNIHQSFTNQSLIERWTNNNFTYKEIQDWANVFKDSFEPDNWEFYIWLRDNKKLTAEQGLNHYILKKEYQEQKYQNRISVIPGSWR